MPKYSPRLAPAHAAPGDDGSAAGLREQNLRFILGLKLHNLRKERGLSLVQLSDACGLSVSYLNEIEKGKKFPKTDKLLALARALGVTYNDLVSSDPGEKLDPIAGLLTTRALENLPFEFYGIGRTALMEVMASAPNRLGALIDMAGKLARRYDVGIEHVQQAALRSDLESRRYHFPDLEEEAETFARAGGWPERTPPELDALRACLRARFGWELDEESLGTQPALADLAVIPHVVGKRKRLFLHPALPAGRRAYYLAREIAAGILALEVSRTEQGEPGPRRFDQMLGNTRAAYLAAALLLPGKALVADLRTFLGNRRWDGDRLLELIAHYGGDPELFLQRSAQLLPAHFPVKGLVINRTEHDRGARDFPVGRELRLGGLPEIAGADLGEHRCRRTVAVRLLSGMSGAPAAPRAGAQRDRVHGTDQAFLHLAVASGRPLHPTVFSCTTLGLEIDDAMRDVVGFVDDPSIEERLTGDTCERCDLTRCEERAAPPVVHSRLQRQAAQQAAIEALLRDAGG